jgi:hypothetical protein
MRNSLEANIFPCPRCGFSLGRGLGCVECGESFTGSDLVRAACEKTTRHATRQPDGKDGDHGDL